MKLIADIPNEWKNISSLFVALGDEQRQRLLLAFNKDERFEHSANRRQFNTWTHRRHTSFKNIAW